MWRRQPLTLFVKLWQAAGRLDAAKGTLKSYLSAICRATKRVAACARCDRCSRWRRTFSPPPKQAAQGLERRELEQLTREALDSLDAQTREIFLRYYFNREKTTQISHSMGVE